MWRSAVQLRAGLRTGKPVSRGYSSVGRAPALQAGGQEFESLYLHKIKTDHKDTSFDRSFYFFAMKLFERIAKFFYFTFLLITSRNVPESIHHITLGELNFLYTVRGPENGKPVVLMHGNGGSHKSMATQQIELAKSGYRVYCLDSRGQGDNVPLQEYHYADMAEDCYLFIKALGLQKPVVGGWSDGGINALLLEMAHPGTSSMIVVAGANLTPECGDGFEQFKAWILEQGTPLVMMMLNEPQIEPEQLSVIPCPALVIAGSEDLISPEHTKLIADSIKDSELVIVEGATHSSYIKKNPRLGKYMLDFMSRRGY